MSIKIDLTGNQYGRLKVISYSHKNKHGSSCWNCLCDCGQLTIKEGYTMKRGDTRSCGCLNKETLKKGNNRRTHDLSKIKEYKIWASMIQRCNNPKNKGFHNYGGRGIKICKRWMKFENFLKDMGERPEGKSLDRINNNKGYNKKNCRWANIKEQGNNRRTNVNITFKNETKTITEWADFLKIPRSTLCLRFKRGLSLKECFSTTHLY